MNPPMIRPASGLQHGSASRTEGGILAITRRSRQFAEIATAVEARLKSSGMDVEAAVVDKVLNYRIDSVAEAMRVSARTALGYAPSDLAESTAKLIVLASQDPPSESGTRRNHLRIVR